MVTPRRRAILLLGFVCIWPLFLTVRTLSNKWRDLSQLAGMGDLLYAPRPAYHPGVPKPPGSNYSKILVAPRMTEEDTSWIAKELPDWESAIYVADDPTAELHPPMNKGHEVMVYLSYIIENYDQLPDIIAFMHSHQFAWHNEEIFETDAAQMLRRLNPARVIREGYMNLRCVWAPGCPSWMHPGTLKEDRTKQEETMLARSWGEIFPEEPIPDVLAQPCCAQFAVSRERILSIPRSRFIFWRDWMLRTELSDYISGRIWEYLWHVIFTGENVVCPQEHVCYCDGYGLCFGGEDTYNTFQKARNEKTKLEDQLTHWRDRARLLESTRGRGRLSESSRLHVPDPGVDIDFQNKIEEKRRIIAEMLADAEARGANPELRAAELGIATAGYAPNDNQLAGLVEAATAAAGQDVSEWAAAAAVAAAAGAVGHHHHLDGYGPEMHIEGDEFGDETFSTGAPGGRQIRGSGPASGPDQVQSSGLSRAVSRKRKRNDDALDPALTAPGPGMTGQHASQQHPQHQNQQQSQQQHHHHHHHHHPQQHDFDGGDLDIRTLPTQQSLSEARAAGVHSAAALFRQPSNSKKYTRPPMSKLFSSLELSPENFLHLQAAAKTYMLDDNHPERRDCVGQRGKGDSEMVKLRLWNCVRHFLDAEGNGERFFGEGAIGDGMGPRTNIWPRDQHRIISLVIPLLRRMVTNERQRQYAIETRKGGATDERKKQKTEDGQQPSATGGSPPSYFSNDQLHMTPPQQQAQQQPQTQGQTQQQQQQQQQQQSEHVAESQPHLQSDATTELGLTDLFLEGYPTEWDKIADSYVLYNQGSELDNLWAISGLQQPEWRGLVAAIDSHYQIYHHGSYECPKPCEDHNIDRILSADVSSSLHWRIGGVHNQVVQNEFATSITRDVSRVIRDTLAKRSSHSPAPGTSTSQLSQPMMHMPAFAAPAVPSSNAFTGTVANAAAPAAPAAPDSQSQILLRVNILQQGKRILQRLDLPAEHCPDLNSLRQAVTRFCMGRLPRDANPSAWNPAWKFKVWLPEGIAPIQTDGEWSIALLSAGSVDWMDGDLKVLVETGQP
ncbi:hypothetical protein ASPZODRAFT_152288 [Penicilliopsis zonata CBS 506.65]|uniref:Uncharacterized protein n=1 Tax=Penicilliopsis zonata CBS 506.65 TaxID=1073090 RepID=A0A1L9SFV8_9EURO|nr:hypothetical protein ASPZODRAFT_152288 [Penicilliopsis zonata CBS 506.65]OJJ46056.1 hypothetical protein ASPZODRAFT_152288 [Penicilliopsis zonata CBS 506.65]